MSFPYANARDLYFLRYLKNTTANCLVDCIASDYYFLPNDPD